MTTISTRAEAGHRWSGWPGAWCLDCGQEDPFEQALADGRVDDCPRTGLPIISDELRDEIAPLMICKEPGSKRHDPYHRAAIARSLTDGSE